MSSLTLHRALNEKMHYLSQRQRVISENIANANTPHYVPRDLRPFTFEETVGRHQMTLTATSAKHMEGTLGSPRPFRDPEQRLHYESAPDGNGVVMEEQIIKGNQTQMDHTLMSRIYEKQVSMMRMALRTSGA
ncbi:MAG: flagellar basal body rod protein FlgB [Alphaproteobacteria bacterium]|nr:flagellar basal body rod protein FlgB [Alphaproteobacteria bacterium SS10]